MLLMTGVAADNKSSCGCPTRLNVHSNELTSLANATAYAVGASPIFALVSFAMVWSSMAWKSAGASILPAASAQAKLDNWRRLICCTAATTLAAAISMLAVPNIANSHASVGNSSGAHEDIPSLCNFSRVIAWTCSPLAMPSLAAAQASAEPPSSRTAHRISSSRCCAMVLWPFFSQALKAALQATAPATTLSAAMAPRTASAAIHCLHFSQALIAPL
mmetsp:Transcript_66071/g.184001  ORF Transcript_66071/g.184001 Transcript_66071/m.184001 type:complete len:218 (-) Transcript_66071:627-1280(-)